MVKSKKGFTDSDMIAMGIGIILATVGIFISFNPELNDFILLCLGVFALIFGIASTIKNTLWRNSSILFSFIAPLIVGLSIKDFTFNLNNINNGLSLIALSYTIFVLPFTRTRQEKEQEEVNGLHDKVKDLTREIHRRNDMISNHEKNIFEKLKEVEKIHFIEKETIKKEYDDRINEIHQYKNSQISTLQKKIELNKKDFESEKNELNKKSRNDILTLNQQHSSEVSLLENGLILLKDKVNLLDKTNKELKIENSKLIKKNNNNDSVDLVDLYGRKKEDASISEVVQNHLDSLQHNIKTEKNNNRSQNSVDLYGRKKVEASLNEAVRSYVDSLQNKREVEKNKNKSLSGIKETKRPSNVNLIE